MENWIALVEYLFAQLEKLLSCAKICISGKNELHMHFRNWSGKMYRLPL